MSLDDFKIRNGGVPDKFEQVVEQAIRGREIERDKTVPVNVVELPEELVKVALRLAAYTLQSEKIVVWDHIMAQPRYRDHDRLVKHGYKVYSQGDEDGIIAEIFKRIGTTNRQFIEIGCGDGKQNNTVKLLIEGWAGCWVEGFDKNVEAIQEHFKRWIDSGHLKLAPHAIGADSINDVIARYDYPASANYDDEADFLSIDIDGQDYWVWKAMTTRPRVVCIEYNANLVPPLSLVVPYDPRGSWDGTNYFGASLNALEKLGREKGYSLVGCSFSGGNAFFVRDDLLVDNTGDYNEKFLKPYTAENHFEPVRYFAALAVGHPANPNYYEQV